MQIAKTIVMSVINNYGIGIGYIYATLDDGRCHQHIKLAIDKVHNQLLQLLRGHLTVTDSHTRLRADAGNHTLQGQKILDAVIDKIDLTTSRELLLNGIANNILGEDM